MRGSGKAGSSGPSSGRGRRRNLIAVFATLAFLATTLAPAGAQAAPPLLRQFCETGSGAGQCSIPHGIAVDPVSGDAYVADVDNKRIEKFTAWGEFLRAWGRDVVASGPGDKGTGFEVCVAAQDVCKAGEAGSDRGEFGGTGGGFLPSGPNGLTVDAAGDVYVVDPTNLRVQKFSPAGEFLLTFGGEVNKTKSEEVGSTEAERNLCPIDAGDVCQEGTEGAGEGQFSNVSGGDSIEASPNGESIYAGDVDRIQRFDTSGHYTGEIKRPGETVDALALDPGGNFYVAQLRVGAISTPGVRKLDPTGEALCTAEAHNPSALATGPAGELYVVDAEENFFLHAPREISRFNSNCAGREALFPPEPSPGQFSADPVGIATSTACGIEGVDLFISNPYDGNSFVKLFGPPPTDFAPPCSPPPLLPPTISETHAVSVGAAAATVKAKLNPHFWSDTTYSVQYAAAACIEDEGWNAPCVSQVPQSPQRLSEEIFDEPRPSKAVFLGAAEPLLPDTEYRYRFVAQSTGSGQALVFGPEASLHTYPLPAPAKADCPNQAYRTAASAPLPDCRAYEMVSPVDKNGGEVGPPRFGLLDQAAADGGALTFVSSTAFAEPEGAPLYNQYLSQREPGGWSTRSINAPSGSVGLRIGVAINPRFKAFDERLCSGWLAQDTDLPLVEGAPRGVSNLYRDRGLRPGCGEPAGYQLQTTVFPPGYEPALEKSAGAYEPQIQGFSADGRSTAFRAAAALSPGACDAPDQGKGIYQVYLAHEGTPGTPPSLISVLPDGQPACTHSSLGTSHYFGGGTYARVDSLHNAVSTDASRIYWTATQDATPTTPPEPQLGADPGHIYLRLNPTQPQSALAAGGASGLGRLSEGSATVSQLVAARGSGDLNAGSATISSLKTTVGRFVVGQPLNPVSGNIASGTKVTAVTPTTLTISPAAIGSGSEVALASQGPLPFAVGQTISGEGIPPATTIVAVAAGSLTLSANATLSTPLRVPLEASSPCTEAAKACTYPVSAAAEALSGTGASLYLDAAADGSVAYFLSGEDLYEFQLSKALAKEPATTLIAGAAKGIMGASSDGSRLYLVSEEALGGEGKAEEPNLYLHERGAGFEFIATLAGPSDAAAGTAENAFPSSIVPIPGRRVSRVSPDGISAAFTAADPALAESVAGYDNTDAQSGNPDREVYLYDAAKASLICASCNPSGARPAGRLILAGGEGAAVELWAAASLPGWVTAMHPGNLLSPDGSRLFFESFEPLVLRDTNGLADVYEWEAAANKADCLDQIGGELYVPASGGCLSLISSGTGSTDSQLIDASASGDDVFIQTTAGLLPQDPSLADAYDARVGGGFPQPIPAAACEGEACQSPPAPPDDPTPASSSFQGAGNVVEPGPEKCAKGKVKKHGRCLKKPRKVKHKRAHHRTNAKRRAVR